MVLSVIIVNYRVKYFLELCLHSVKKALKGLEAEVWVVDNDSGDGSVEYLRPKFPWVQFIANNENSGFGAANNLALTRARGKYILFLNPDTVLPEDFATVCLSFLESTPWVGEDAIAADCKSASVGAVGVRMVDGSGRFLPESRRGYPSAWVSFCKMAGLTAIFPRSRLFAGYYLGHLPADVAHRAAILSGACFCVPRSVLDKSGVFDEQFFMYAEDIDLSYRIEMAGFHNYYLPGTTIVHFKGESTRKDIRYVKLFYRAMSRFRKKHSRGALSGVVNTLMEGAIWLRACVAAAGRAIRREEVGKAIAGDTLRSLLKGDPAGVRRLSELLLDSGERRLVMELSEADEIIFCEGETYSFKEAIAALQKACGSPGVRGVKFFAAGSASVTGSGSKEERGESIIL